MVSCADCGFLAMESGDRSEVADLCFRETGVPAFVGDPESPPLWLPACWREAAHLEIEYQYQLPQTRSHARACRNVLNRNYECELYREWDPGLSLEEHLDQPDERAPAEDGGFWLSLVKDILAEPLFYLVGATVLLVAAGIVQILEWFGVFDFT